MMSSNIVCSLIPSLSLLLRREPGNEATLSPVNPISNSCHRNSIGGRGGGGGGGGHILDTCLLYPGRFAQNQ